VQESDKLVDLALLQFYAKEWDQYTSGANYVNKLFNYLNKHWVKREKDEGRKEIYTVYTVGVPMTLLTIARTCGVETKLFQVVPEQYIGESPDSGHPTPDRAATEWGGD
jgi:hypothetical protein